MSIGCPISLLPSFPCSICALAVSRDEARIASSVSTIGVFATNSTICSFSPKSVSSGTVVLAGCGICVTRSKQLFNMSMSPNGKGSTPNCNSGLAICVFLDKWRNSWTSVINVGMLCARGPPEERSARPLNKLAIHTPNMPCPAPNSITADAFFACLRISSGCCMNARHSGLMRSPATPPPGTCSILLSLCTSSSLALLSKEVSSSPSPTATWKANEPEKSFHSVEGCSSSSFSPA
mmetsp:Transcript_77194/g.121906  ORF Transcript_77194/g.121906 Transcript_77194/m.121906 type:complete len:236 (+) Transcript_77194:619-1326(+)